MKYQIEIAETVRNSLRDEATLTHIETRDFDTLEEVKSYLADRYGRVPGGRNKIYRDIAGKPEETGFIHSFWDQDISHSSKSCYRTDWIEITEITTKPVLLGR